MQKCAKCLECKTIYECILLIAGLRLVHGFVFNVQMFTVRSTNPRVQEVILTFEIIPLPRKQGDAIDGWLGDQHLCCLM